MNKSNEQPLTRREKRERFERANQSVLGVKNFNRNQTIPGIHRDRSERLNNRKMVVRRRKITGFLVFLGISSILILTILLQLVFSFSVVNFENNTNISSSDYISSIEQYYAAQPIERITSYLNKDNLLIFMQKNNPEIENIKEVKMTGILKFDFVVSFRKPVASWSSGDKKLYVDSNGVSFERNYYPEPDLAVLDESGIKVASGKTVASSTFIGFVGRVISFAESEGLKITKILIPTQSLRQIHIYVDKAPYPAKMLITESAKGQVSNFSKAIRYFSKNNIKPEYIDLRVEGKGYYKG